jgi:hypothetical protein
LFGFGLKFIKRISFAIITVGRNGGAFCDLAIQIHQRFRRRSVRISVALVDM